MVDVPYPKSSTPGLRAGEGEGRYLNGYPIQEGARSYVRRCLGLAVLITTTGAAGLRGMIEVNGAYYLVYSDKVAYVTFAGASPTVSYLTGTVAGTDPVTLARNNRVTTGVSTPDVVVVRRDGGAYVLTTTTCSAYPDADLPATVNSVAFLGGFFLFTIADGRIFASELNSTDINALSFATAESNSDGLLRGVVNNGRYYAFGTSSIEMWTNQGFSPFPLQPASSNKSIGLRGAMAVAGSVSDVGWDHGLFFIASDGSVRALSGYDDAVISTPDVERFISASVPAGLEMMVYIERTRPMVVISSAVGTWAYDVRAQSWHERLSGAQPRWRAKWSLYTSGGARFFGDTQSGNILIPSTSFTEPSTGMVIVIESGPMKQFPAGVTVPDVFFDVTEADGAALDISWSKNGGKTWSTPDSKSMADTDVYPVRINGLGQSTHHGIRFRAVCDDDVDFSFMGAGVPDPQIRAQAAT